MHNQFYKTFIATQYKIVISLAFCLIRKLLFQVNAAKDAKGDNTQVNTDASELRSSLIKWNRIIKILQNKVAQKRVQT